jgi:hypothetical protein
MIRLFDYSILPPGGGRPAIVQALWRDRRGSKRTSVTKPIFPSPGGPQGGFWARIRAKAHFTDVFTKNIRPKGPFLEVLKSGLRLVYTGFGTDLRG